LDQYDSSHDEAVTLRGSDGLAVTQDYARPDGVRERRPATKRTGTFGRRIVALVPNALTLGAVVCGLTSIRLSGEGLFGWAMAAILAAAFLDVADGYAARRLSAQSAIGAELDSLADFLNFGVAPAMLLYDRHLYLLGGAGWCAAALYVLATGVRLARFNVMSRETIEVPDKKWFRGLPSTGASVALLATDAVSQFVFQSRDIPALMAGSIVVVSGLMVSPLPVPSVSALAERVFSNKSKC
jgi:CDP-diacylglycerol---serine O-phosphatidyltransferase